MAKDKGKKQPVASIHRSSVYQSTPCEPFSHKYLEASEAPVSKPSLRARISQGGAITVVHGADRNPFRRLPPSLRLEKH